MHPFDINELTSAVREALDQPRVPHEPVSAAGGARQAVTEVLLRHSREAVFRWALRLEQEEPWRSRQDLGIGGLIDHMPSLFDVLATRIATATSDESLAASGSLDTALEHARTRHAQGFTREALIHEYAVIRNELPLLLRQHLEGSVDEALLLDFIRELDLSIDLVIEASVKHFDW